jgi:hypothetical protein
MGDKRDESAGETPSLGVGGVDFYGAGGPMQPGLNYAFNDTGKPEPVFTEEQYRKFLNERFLKD